jgi:hypothetical protein
MAFLVLNACSVSPAEIDGFFFCAECRVETAVLIYGHSWVRYMDVQIFNANS